MARLSHAEPRGLDLMRRLTYRWTKRLYGRALEPLQVVAHHRPLMLGYGVHSMVAERYARSVDPSLKNLAMLRTAQLVGCEWCLDFGSYLARKGGIPEGKLRELTRWHESERFSELERLVLEYADGMTRTPVTVGDDLFARLRAQFDERQMVELTMAIALENLHSRSNWALGIESEGFSDGSYCVVPELRAQPFAEVGGAR
jgi:AhpD family alkylhydroperoxidase